MHSDLERQIFKFHDGSTDAEGKLRLVARDPMVIHRRLAHAVVDGKTYEQLQAQLKDNKPGGTMPVDAYLDLCQQATAVLRDVFEVKPLDDEGNGLTEGEVMNILVQFNEFSAAVKKNTEASQDSSEPSAGPLADLDLASTETMLPPSQETLEASLRKRPGL